MTKKYDNPNAIEGNVDACATPGLTNLDVAIQALVQEARPIRDTEHITLDAALHRVLAKEIVSTVAVPPFDNSAVDGYAVRLETLTSRTVPVSQRIPAGLAPQPLAPGTAARIFTGACIPENADAVIMQEQCQLAGDQVQLPETIAQSQNIRPAGQDISINQVILKKGRKLQPQDLGLIASIGQPQVEVYRRLKVSVVSSGDELVEPGTPLQSGQIYNSNRFVMKGLLKAAGYEPVDHGIMLDDFRQTEEQLLELANRADVIITTGGVSVGEEDHIKNVVEKHGALKLWRLAIKPGKPFAYGTVGETPLLGLPGNPGAVFVTFCILANSFLRASQGMTDNQPVAAKYPIDFPVLKPGKRREYLRVKLIEGQLKQYPNQSSGVLSSASWGDGLAVIPEHQTLEVGTPVDYLSFKELFFH